jgi:Rad3-related DNA helicase
MASHAKCFSRSDQFCQLAAFYRAKEPYNIFLELAPIDIGEIIQENLFAVKKSVIMTSATLTVNKTFDYYKQRLVSIKILNSGLFSRLWAHLLIIRKKCFLLCLMIF